MIGLEPLQALVDLGPGRLPVAQPGLGGQEDPAPDVGHPRAQPQLGVAVAGRNVEMVDPGVQGQPDRGVGGGLIDLGQGGRAIEQDRTLVAKATKSAQLHDTQLLPSVGNPTGLTRSRPRYQGYPRRRRLS
jgi:hypothetical protein